MINCLEGPILEIGGKILIRGIIFYICPSMIKAPTSVESPLLAVTIVATSSPSLFLEHLQTPLFP